MTDHERSDRSGTTTGERGIGNETDAMSPLADRPGSAPVWAALLAGPVLWITHFAVVYLASEVTCRERWAREVAGVEAATLITLVATAVALVAIAIAALFTVRLWRRSDRGSRQLMVVGLALDALFAASVLAVGIPALVLDPC